MRHLVSVTLYGMLIMIGTAVILLSIFWLPSMAATLGQQNPEYAFLQAPLLFGTYVTLIPFILALSEAWKIVKAGIPASRSLTRIKWYAFFIAVIYGAGIIYLLLHHALHPGLAVIGATILFVCLTVAAFAVFLQRLFLQSIR